MPRKSPSRRRERSASSRTRRLDRLSDHERYTIAAAAIVLAEGRTLTNDPCVTLTALKQQIETQFPEAHESKRFGDLEDNLNWLTDRNMICGPVGQRRKLEKPTLMDIEQAAHGATNLAMLDDNGLARLATKLSREPGTQRDSVAVISDDLQAQMLSMSIAERELFIQEKLQIAHAQGLETLMALSADPYTDDWARVSASQSLLKHSIEMRAIDLQGRALDRGHLQDASAEDLVKALKEVRSVMELNHRAPQDAQIIESTATKEASIPAG